MSDPKDHHVIPNCYLKEWCDPDTPDGHTPYIWRISKDGKTNRRKAPEKSFTSRHRYRMSFPNGDQTLFVENTLGRVENDFVGVREKIKKRQPIDTADRLTICLFTAAMQSRTIRAGENWRKSSGELHDLTAAMEQQYETNGRASDQAKYLRDNAHQLFVLMSLEQQTPLYMQMEMSICMVEDEKMLITSDSPCVWFNSKAHTFPPAYRSPGLLQKDIEVRLPLTPKYLLLFSHVDHGQYVNIGGKIVDELNRMTRLHCTNEFVSWKGETVPYWFTTLELPSDAWEKTDEGKETLKRQAEWDAMRAEWEQKTGRKP
jgi:hypothetical protein